MAPRVLRFCILYIQGKLESDYQNSTQFDGERRPPGSRSDPIACRVCDKVFFNNIDLVLHFEFHVKDGFRLGGRERAAMRLSWYSHSSLARVNEARLVMLSKMDGYLRPRPLSADHTPSDAPVMNVDHPVNPSIMGQFGAASSSSSPLMDSQSGARNFAYGSAPAPHFPNNIPPASQLEKPNPELIVLSDDEEEDDNETPAEIDLTLKL